jgi:hypothetical protein
MERNAAMKLAIKKSLVAILVAGSFAGISPAVAEGDGSVLPDNQPIQSIAGPQGPATQGSEVSPALAFAPPIMNPLASYNPPAPGGVCWIATDADRPFGYWRQC